MLWAAREKTAVFQCWWWESWASLVLLGWGTPATADPSAAFLLSGLGGPGVPAAVDTTPVVIPVLEGLFPSRCERSLWERSNHGCFSVLYHWKCHSAMGQKFLLLWGQERSDAACALPLTVCVHAQLLFFFGGFFFPFSLWLILFQIKRSVFYLVSEMFKFCYLIIVSFWFLQEVQGNF